MSESFFENEVIHFIGEIGNREKNSIIERLEDLTKKGCPELVLHISSGGGSVDACLEIYDILKLYRGNKIGIVTSGAMSMAAVLLQVCDERYATRHAKIMFHYLNSEIDYKTLLDANKFDRFFKSFKERQERIISIISERSGNNKQIIREILDESLKITAEEALEYKFIDHICE